MVTQNGTEVTALLTETTRGIIRKKGEAEKIRNGVEVAVVVQYHPTVTGKQRDGNHRIPTRGPSKCK
jgi:hypothetical protein